MKHAVLDAQYLARVAGSDDLAVTGRSPQRRSWLGTWVVPWVGCSTDGMIREWLTEYPYRLVYGLRCSTVTGGSAGTAMIKRGHSTLTM